MEDFDIVLDILSGNRNAYAELVRRYQERVRGYCLAMFADATQADDAAQEIFIKAYQALDQFHGKASFPTWLYRIAANHCMDILRKTKRQKLESWEALVEREGEKAEQLLEASPQDPFSEEERIMVQTLLHRLPDQAKTVLILREMEGMSYQEIAEILDCSLDAVKSRLKRARDNLGKKVRHFLMQTASKS